MMVFIIVLILFLILLFTFSNGAHDVSNIIATMISSGAMTARRALILAVLCEIIGPLVGGTMVANAMASLINAQAIAQKFGSGCVLMIVAAGVGAAIGWNFITLFLGLPSSSSHALCGGLLGAALMATRHAAFIQWGFKGFNVLRIRGVAGIGASLFLSPLLGFIGGYLAAGVMRALLKTASPRVNVFLKQAQTLTASALAFSHGTNDAQKSMGLIALVLATSGLLPGFQIHFWIKVLCAVAMTLGAITGGWRIVKTIGRGIFHLRPEHGFETQIASSLIILGNSLVGGPVSTTHIVSTTVMGVGTAVRIKAVRWQKVREILLAWIITLPFTGILGGIFYLVFSLLHLTI